MIDWLKELDASPKKYKKSKVLTHTTDKTDEISKSFIGDRFKAHALNEPTSMCTTKMSSKEESKIRAWFAQIEEIDPDLIAEVMDRCRTNPESLQYFLQRAEKCRR